MASISINGGTPLYGNLKIKGAKNAVLPIIAASILTHGKVELRNCPDLSDVKSALNILKKLGGKFFIKGTTIWIDCTDINNSFIGHDDAKEMRSSIIFLGALLARNKQAKLFFPGGCELGPRPIDLHIQALKTLGAQIHTRDGFLECSAPDLQGAVIHLDFPSVGATENTLIAAVRSEGVTIIENAAREPEIVDLAAFLNKCGANIQGAGTGTIRIAGVKKLHGCTHEVMPDRIVTLTYMAAVGAAGGDVTLEGTKWEDFKAALPLFTQSGVKLTLAENSIRVVSDGNLKAVSKVTTQPYPGFPTDAQPIAVVMTLKAKGESVFEETIFSGRYKYVPALKKMGADIEINKRIARVRGVDTLTGGTVHCTDLRGGAALVIAGLVAKGETTVCDIEHLDRGYSYIEKDLQKLGASIKRG